MLLLKWKAPHRDRDVGPGFPPFVRVVTAPVPAAVTQAATTGLSPQTEPRRHGSASDPRPSPIDVTQVRSGQVYYSAEV